MRIVKLMAVTATILFALFGPIFGNLPFVSQAQIQIFLPIIFKAPYEPAKGVVMTAPYPCSDLDKLNVGWYYRDAYPAPGCPANDKRFVPRLYNSAAVFTGTDLADAINNAKASGWLMGFVEPNLSWQGNTTPYQGAIAWRAVEQAIINDPDLVLGEDIKLVSPSPNQWSPQRSPDGYGYKWTWEMVKQYKKLYCPSNPTSCKPHFDALGWNYYLEFNIEHPTVSEFSNYFSARRAEALNPTDYDPVYDDVYDVPFWVLEYAGACWNTRESTTRNSWVMANVTPYFSNTSYITRYAWFSNRWPGDWDSCSLLDPATGSIRSLGWQYAQISQN